MFVRRAIAYRLKRCANALNAVKTESRDLNYVPYILYIYVHTLKTVAVIAFATQLFHMNVPTYKHDGTCDVLMYTTKLCPYTKC